MYGLAIFYSAMRRKTEADEALTALTTKFADVGAYGDPRYKAFLHRMNLPE